MRCKLTLEMPPSDNEIYFNIPKGGRSLKSKAKKFKRLVKDQVSTLIASTDTSGEDFIPNVPYEFIITIYFEETDNKTWGRKRGAETRYKKLDSGNRQKLVIDSVMSAIGIDDRHIFREVLRKRCDPENPRVVILVREKEARYG